jgi:glucokinase
MYAGVDVGGTKTLLAVLDDNGVIKSQIKFLTPPNYEDFIDKLSEKFNSLKDKDFKAAGVAIPGKINRTEGIGLAFGNLKWHNVPAQSDCEKIFGCPVMLENDANLAGLSEAMLIPQYSRVLYATISTGIGTGIIVDRKIDPGMSDSEGGQMLMEYRGKHVPWESFASGHALVKKYGVPAKELTDKKDWKQFAYDLSLGFIKLIAMIQPDAIVLGGSVGHYFDQYGKFLRDYLKEHETPLVNIPPFFKASRPDEAVIYGCYDIAKEHYGNH